MNTKDSCLFGGALLAAGLTSAAIAQCDPQIVEAVPATPYREPGFFSESTFTQLHIDGDRLVAHFRNQAYDENAYVFSYADRLLTFDISDPLNLTLLGRWDVGGLLPIGHDRMLVIDDQLAMLRNGSSNLLDLYDFSNPSAPVLVNTVTLRGLISGIKTWNGDIIALSLEGSPEHNGPVVEVIDVSNPLTPSIEELLIPSTSNGGTVLGYPVDGLISFVQPTSLSEVELVIVDLNGETPTLVSTTLVSRGSTIWSTFVRDALVTPIASFNFAAFDVSDPGNPGVLPVFDTQLNFPIHPNSFEQLVTVFQSGIGSDYDMYIIDYTDPSNPMIIGQVDTQQAFDAVADDRGFVYRSGRNSLDVIAIGSCATPTVLSLSPGGATVEGGPSIEVAVEHLNGAGFQWMLDGTPIADNATYTGTDTPTLTVASNPQATGLYSVELTGGGGSSTIAGDAIVGIRPDNSDFGLADINGDGIIDNGDILMFIEVFLAAVG